MKRLLLLVLVLAICLPLNGYAGDEEVYAYVVELLEAGEYDKAIEVIEGLKAQHAPNGGQELIQQMLVPETNGTDWMFHMDLINNGSLPIRLERVQIIDERAGMPFGSHEFAGADLERLGLADCILQPNEGRGWDDAHPVVPDFDQRDYRFCFRSDDGREVVYSFVYSLSGAVPQAPALPDWSFYISLENHGSGDLALVSLEIIDLMDEQPVGSFLFEGERLADIGLGDVVLVPGMRFGWQDGHPYTDQFNGRIYCFGFLNGAGEIESRVFRFENLDRQGKPVDYSADPGKDLATLRHDADFEVEVAPGVYWVPASSLGGSRYSNMQVHDMLGASPEEKQAAASTLYEALQFFQVGNFVAADDNIRLMENGVNWEHHKPGDHAVRTNCGCCATDSNWLRYMLDGDYDEIGFIATSQRDGSGHVYNYILQDDWYYFIDLTHHRTDSGMNASPVEDGSIDSYYAADFLPGSIHKARSVEAYVDYVQQAQENAPGLMFMYSAENVLALDSIRDGDRVVIVYEDAEGVALRVIFDDPADALEYTREPSPRILPDWSQAPDAVFPG